MIKLPHDYLWAGILLDIRLGPILQWLFGTIITINPAPSLELKALYMRNMVPVIVLTRIKCFITHDGVFQNKCDSKKIRVVFDASASPPQIVFQSFVADSS